MNTKAIVLQQMIVFSLLCLFELALFENIQVRTKRQAVDNPTILTMCIIVERNTTSAIYDYNRAAAAIDLAVDYSNEYVIAAPYVIRSLYVDLGREAAQSCSGRNHVVAQAMNLHDRGIDCSVYLGPGCGLVAETLSDIAGPWDIPIIACPSAELGLTAEPGNYTTVTRLSVTYTTMTDVLIRLFDFLNYTTPVFFQDGSMNFFDQMGILVQQTIKVRRPALYYASKYVTFSSLDKNGLAIRPENISKFLLTASETSRIFVLCADAKTVRRIMIVAHGLGMTTGDYVFIATELYPSALWGNFTWNSFDREDSVAREAYEALLILALKVNPADDSDIFWERIKKVSEQKFNFRFRYDEKVDPIVTHFYDAVLLYANVVTNMSAAKIDFNSGVLFTNFTAMYSYYSPVNGNVSFNGDSDRLSDYVMRSMNNRTGQHDVIFEFKSGSNDVQSLVPVLEWVDGKPFPPNNPRCGFKNEAVICQPVPRVIRSDEIAAAVVVPILLVIGVSLIVYYVAQRFFGDHSDPFWWRILSQDLEVKQGRGATSAATSKSLKGESQLISSLSLTNPSKKSTTTDGPMSVGKSALYMGASVSLLEFPDPKLRVPGNLPRETVVHGNVQKFIGVAVNDANLCEYVVGEFCQKGCLKDLINNDSLQLDWELKHSVIKDLANGMLYLHSSQMVSHGHLNDINCLVESRFILKIAGFGLPSLRKDSDLRPPIAEVDDRDFSTLLWRAPEHLRRTMPPGGSQKGDVYSFSILLQQIVLRSEPYQKTSADHRKPVENSVPAKDIVLEVKRGMNPPLRPLVPVSALVPELHDLMDNCWDEDPAMRPTFLRIKAVVSKVAGKSGDNIVDHLIRRMEQYAAGLESQVQHQMRQFMEERQRSSELLQIMLPKIVAEALVKGQIVKPEVYESTTVYFGTVTGFKDAVEISSPVQTVQLLNKLYSVCDDVILGYDVYKVETVADAYLVVSGLPVRNGMRHVPEIASMSLRLRRDVAVMKMTLESAKDFQLRVGIHTGPCVAGVVGIKMPKYCLFGDTVNTASRMESHSESGKIQCSAISKNVLEKSGDFLFADRGTTLIKGKGNMETFWLLGKA